MTAPGKDTARRTVSVGNGAVAANDGVATGARRGRELQEEVIFQAVTMIDDFNQAVHCVMLEMT
jgi:hypothetical protein